MKELMKRNPVYYSIILTFIIAILFVLADFFIPSQLLNNNQQIFIDSILRIIFSVSVIILLGYAYSTNGFKHVFSLRGFGKGLFASIAIFVYMLAIILNFFLMTKMNKPSGILFIILQQIAIGLFEELLYRGLFMSGMILRWSFTILGRISMIIISGLISSFFYIFTVFLNGNLQGSLLNGLFAFILGMAFAAIYLYSKNLLSSIFIHILYNIVIQLFPKLVYGVSAGLVLNIIDKVQLVLFYIIIPLFAIIFALRAKPFKDEGMNEIRIYGI
jgi:membrane protease YdiL (CAAX protease family)